MCIITIMGDEVMNVKTEEGDNEQFRKPLAIATAATEEKKEPIEQGALSQI